jgi:hypothetical protein
MFLSILNIEMTMKNSTARKLIRGRTIAGYNMAQIPLFVGTFACFVLMVYALAL